MSKPQQGRAKSKKRPRTKMKDLSGHYDGATKNPDHMWKGRKYSRVTKAVMPK